MEFRFGGKLEIGDFILIAYTNCVFPGWYCGEGRGTLQYYSVYEVINVDEQYNDFLKNKDYVPLYIAKKFVNGFTKKSLWKSYINSLYLTRVIKVKHPELLLTDEGDIENYQKSKQILINLGIIKN